MAAGESQVLVRLRMLGASQFSSDAKGASKGLDSIDKSAKGVSTRFSGLKGAFGTAAVFAKRAAFGAGAAGVAAGVMGVKYNAALEQSTTAFKGLLGSQSKAEAMMARIQAFAAKTPFEQAQLTDAAQRWLGVGNSAKSVIPSMRAVGDAVAGVGGAPEDVMGVVTALTQMQNKGKATSEELQQIAERNIPSFKILAKQLGLTGAQLSDQLQKGAIGADKAVGALLKGMEGKYGGAMTAQSKTFNGMMSTLKDNANIILGQAFKPVFEFLKNKILPVIATTMTMLVKAGKQGGLKGMFYGLQGLEGQKGPAGLLGTVATAIQNVFDAVSGMDWGGIMDVIAKLGPAFSAVTAAGGGTGLASQLGNITKVAGPFTTVITAIVGLLEKFLGLPGAPQVVGALLALAAAGAVANKATGGLVGALAKFGGQAFTMANTVATLITQIIAYRTAKLLSTGATIADSGAQGANTVAITANNAVQQMGIIQLVRYRIGQLASAAASVVARAATMTWTAAQWLLNAALTANPIGLVIAGIALLVAGLVLAYTKSETFRNIVSGAFNAVKHAAVSAFNWVKKNWPLLLAIITGPIGIAVLAVVKNFDRIKGAFRGAINWIIRAWNGLEFKIPEVNTHIPGVGKVGGMTLGVPDIPEIGTGGTIKRGGAAIVGDRGPELVRFPTGSTVYDAGQTRAARGSLRSMPVTVIANLHLSGRQIHSEVFRVERAQAEMS